MMAREDGAAARAMSNFGFSQLRVVRPYEPAFREARSAVGASDLLARAEQYETVGQAVADCTLVAGTTAVRHRELQHPSHRLETGGGRIRKHLRASSARVAILFGSEKFGLSTKDLSHCHWLIRIPTVDANISMNLGQAVAICLYEMIRDSKIAGTKAAKNLDKLPPATSAEIERITALLLDALHISGFLTLRRVADAEERIRRLVRRLNLPARDAVIWLGIFRQIVWKMNSGENAKSVLDDKGPAAR